MDIRYYCEHVAFYKLFSHDPVKVISKILTEKEDFIYNYFLHEYDSHQEAFPYQKKDFKVEIKEYDQLEFAIITMPEAFIKPSLCHKIIITYSMNLDLYMYFTVEDGYDPLFGKYNILGAWIEGSHMTFGTLNENDKIEEKIYNIAMC